MGKGGNWTGLTGFTRLKINLESRRQQDGIPQNCGWNRQASLRDQTAKRLRSLSQVAAGSGMALRKGTVHDYSAALSAASGILQNSAGAALGRCQPCNSRSVAPDWHETAALALPRNRPQGRCESNRSEFERPYAGAPPNAPGSGGATSGAITCFGGFSGGIFSPPAGMTLGGGWIKRPCVTISLI